MPMINRPKPLKKSRYKKIRLDKNEKNDEFKAEFLNSFKKLIKSYHLSSYPETYEVYKAISKKLKIKKDNILLTNGADGAIENCFKLFTIPKSKIIKINPTYKMVDVYSKIYQTKNLEIGIDKDLNINYQKLIESINKNISMVIIANPNSPTGKNLSQIQILNILKKTKKYNIPFVIDEAYFEFSNYTSLKFSKSFSNLIIIRTFSKAFGMAGLRIGYILSNKKMIKKLEQFRPCYEISSIGALAINHILKNYKIVENNIKNILHGKVFFEEFLKKNKINFVESKTNFLHVNFAKKKHSAKKIFNKNNILVKDSINSFKYKNFIRITIGPKETMKKVAKLVLKIISN